jgi:hypothetical protein
MKGDKMKQSGMRTGGMGAYAYTITIKNLWYFSKNMPSRKEVLEALRADLSEGIEAYNADVKCVKIEYQEEASENANGVFAWW